MATTRTDEDGLRAALLPELELIRLLGSGASADVYLAREPALQRLVAVKVLHDNVAADAVARRRFEREAQSAARIAHPNVTAIHRVGRTPEGRPFLVMEYVDGRTLADLVEAGSARELERARAILVSVAGALATAHERGIIHRDVRPGNVLVENRTGRAVLGDFGIAALLETGAAAATRLTAAGTLLGDTRYLSPEQVRGEPVVEQSDVYAFGILAFELLAGRGPYQAGSPAELLAAHLQQTPADLRTLRPDIDAPTAALIMRCLARDPNQRPLARELAAQLAAPAAQLAAPAAQPSESTGSLGAFLRELRRRRVYQVLAAYGAVALTVFGVAQVVYDAFDLSRASYQVLVITTLAGFPISLVLAWVYDIRAGGIERTKALGGARLRGFMWAGLLASLLLVALAGWLLLR